MFNFMPEVLCDKLMDKIKTLPVGLEPTTVRLRAARSTD